MSDLKLSLRRLFRNPGFTVVAMLTMALCIGANLTIFAVVDAISEEITKKVDNLLQSFYAKLESNLIKFTFSENSV